MKQLHKRLISILLATAALYAAVKVAETKLTPATEHDADSLSDGPKFSHSKRWETENPAERKFRLRSKKMTQEEIAEFLDTLIIPEIDFKNILLTDALKVINQKIAEQTPDDQARPRILADKSLLSPITILNRVGGIFVETDSTRITEIRERNMTAREFLKFISLTNGCDYWIYKGNVYVGSDYTFFLGNDFFKKEVFTEVKLDSTDVTQLTEQIGLLIHDREYYGIKPSFQIIMSDKARIALNKGEVQMLAIRLDMQNTTLNEVFSKISEQSNGIINDEHGGLRFKPFGNAGDDPDNDDPFRPNTIDEILNNPNRQTTPANGAEVK